MREIEASCQEASHLIDKGGDHPCHDGGVDGGEGGPAPGARLVLDGHNGGYAGEIEQDEEQIAIGREGRDAISEHQLAQTGVFRIVVAERVVVGK